MKWQVAIALLISFHPLAMEQAAASVDGYLHEMPLDISGISQPEVSWQYDLSSGAVTGLANSHLIASSTDHFSIVRAERSDLHDIVQWASFERSSSGLKQDRIVVETRRTISRLFVSAGGVAVLSHDADQNAQYDPSAGATLSSFGPDGALRWTVGWPSECLETGEGLMELDEEGGALVSCRIADRSEQRKAQLLVVYDRKGRHKSYLGASFSQGPAGAYRTDNGWIVAGNDEVPKEDIAEPPSDQPFFSPMPARFVRLEGDQLVPVEIYGRASATLRTLPIEHKPIHFRLSGPLPWIVVDIGQDNENRWLDMPSGSDHFRARNLPFFYMRVVAEFSTGPVLFGQGPWWTAHGFRPPCGILALSKNAQPLWYLDTKGITRAAQAGDTDEIIVATYRGAKSCADDNDSLPISIVSLRSPNAGSINRP